jgi:dihydrofolate reductase
MRGAVSFLTDPKEEAMRRIRYALAMSLDGYIAGPNGEADWIVSDPEIDFRALFAQFDTWLVGRRTYDVMVRAGHAPKSKPPTYVFSRTLAQADHPNVTIVSDVKDPRIAALREKPGKDIWLFGGGELFASLLDAGLVDTVEVSIIPVLLGGGIPLLPPPARQTKLTLTGHRIYKAGIVSLVYSVQ